MKMKNMVAALTAVAVSAASFAAMSFSASAADVKGNAYFIGALGGEQCWNLGEVNASSTTAQITGDGQYTVEWVAEAGGTATVQFLAVCISPAEGVDNFGVATFEGLQVSLDELWIDGVKQEGYVASANAIDTNYFEGGAGVTRIYLRDEWAGTGVSDLAGDTTITSSVKAVFSVSGLPAEDAPTEAPEETTTAPEETTAAPEETTTANGTTAASTTAAGGTTTAATTKAATSTTTNADTSDNGIAVVLAGLTAAGAVALVSRKRK